MAPVVIGSTALTDAVSVPEMRADTPPRRTTATPRSASTIGTKAAILLWPGPGVADGRRMSLDVMTGMPHTRRKSAVRRILVFLHK